MSQRDGDLYRGRLNEILRPTFVLHGSHDEYAPVSDMEELARRILNARLSVYAEDGHSVHGGRSTREPVLQKHVNFC